MKVLPTPSRKVHLIVTGSEVYSGRIKDGFEPVERNKSLEMGSDLADKQLATDDPDQISELIKKAKGAGAEIILVSGGMSVDPDDKTPEGIRRSGAKVESHGFPVLPGSMFVMAYLNETPFLGLSGCVLHDPFTALDDIVAEAISGRKNFASQTS